jgi:hypothetical protein
MFLMLPLPAATDAARWHSVTQESHSDEGDLRSHLLVPFSSPEPGSKKVTFLPSPAFFTGVLTQKKDHEHSSHH